MRRRSSLISLPVVARELDVQPARPCSGVVVGGKEPGYLSPYVVEVAGLGAVGRWEGVVVHWVARPNGVLARVTHCFEKWSQAIDAGLIGRSFGIDISRFSPRTFRGASSFGSGSGMLELLPQ